MKQLPLIIGVIMAVILAAAGGYYYMNSRSVSPGSTETQPDSMKEDDGVTGMMSVKDLMALGKNQECTFSSTDPEVGTTTGTSYISGENVRTDFSGTYTDGSTYDGSMIMDGKYIYTWNSTTPTGIKMPITDNLKDDIEETIENEDYSQENFDPDEKIEYNCRNWSVDESKFIPPSDITFTDFSEQMKTLEDLQKSMGSQDIESSEDACSVCDSLPAEAAEACRAGLSC